MLGLKDHPFAVETFFDMSLVLTYALPKDDLKKLLPPCLEPDTFGDQHAFLALAMVQTRSLRPKGFPAFMGNDFFLIGYRVFVKYIDSRGKRLRGLYILKSETNKSKMSFFGNIFTHYNYTTTDIEFQKNGDAINVNSKNSGLLVKVKKGDHISLPANSPFSDWKEARRFAGPLPFTFTWNGQKQEVLIIEGVRENWIPAPVEVLQHESKFISESRFANARLANAFIVENIPYYWKKGKTDKWKP